MHLDSKQGQKWGKAACTGFSSTEDLAKAKTGLSAVAELT